MLNNTGDSEPTDALEIAVAAAMAQQWAGDTREFLRLLADLLETALPVETTVTRAGLFGGDKRPVRRVEATFSRDGGITGTRYAIDDSGRGVLAPAKTQVVHGVALKTEPMAMEAWIAEVGAAIGGRAEQNKATRDALEQLL